MSDFGPTGDVSRELTGEQAKSYFIAEITAHYSSGTFTDTRSGGEAAALGEGRYAIVADFLRSQSDDEVKEMIREGLKQAFIKQYPSLADGVAEVDLSGDYEQIKTNLRERSLGYDLESAIRNFETAYFAERAKMGSE